MKIVFTKHAQRKQEILEEFGWSVSLDLVKRVVQEPDFTSKTRRGQQAATKEIDAKHILRVVYEVRSGIITVITFYIARKGRYE